MSGERSADWHGYRYVRMPPEPEEEAAAASSSSASFRLPESARVFDELPRARIVGVSRPDAGDITPMLLSYTIEVQYKQFRWLLYKKASQVLYLHFALKRRVFLEEFHEKQEQVKEWLQNLGIGEYMPVVHDDDEADDVHLPSQHDEHSLKNRNVPSSAVLPVIRPALGRQQSVSDRAKVTMQEYLNHFLGNLDIVNSREVCKFLEVSQLSFLPEYGPKLKEDYVTVRHLPKIETDRKERCCSCSCFSFCSSNWQKVWAVLKPGFLALLQDPFDPKLLDIVIFGVSPYADRNEGQITLAKEIKERNPLHFGFEVSSGGRTIKLRTRSSAKVKDWVTAINAARRPPEGWCSPHRFGSFAPPRGLTEDGSVVQWFVDGRAAFDAIASSIEEAKSEIFITDWWLCPELYLRRPFQYHGSSRLEVLLESRAKQGVQIYILLYKEVSLALKINSMYSKQRLLNIHENVKVLRYPDHFSTGIYLWSHHEKIVIVDNQVCYIGGLDLCFGRYDTPEHKVMDVPSSTWPGKDYYNPRESEPNSWEDTMKDELDRAKYPRMPWHDVQCALYGPPCRDVARHFVQRWNYAKRNKAPNEQAIPLLMPHHHMVIPHYMGPSKETNGEAESKQIHDKDAKVNRLNLLTTPASCQDIPLLLPHEPDHQALPNGDLGLNGLDINNGLSDHSNKTSWNQRPPSNRKVKEDLSLQDLQMKGFVDNLGSPETSLVTCYDNSKPNLLHMDKEWWEAQERGYQVASVLDVGEVGPRAACHCQVVRSVGPWSAGTTHIEGSIHNAYVSLIEKAEHFVYIENQFFISGLSGDDTIKNRVLEALYRRVLRAEKEKKCFRVIIVIPLLPGFQGGIDDGGAASVRAIMHWQYRTICRGPNSIIKNLYDVIGSKVNDHISFYGLRAHGRLGDGGPLVTNQIYVHSKLMIIDDRMTLIGSANINDRSLLGSRDSEIGMIIEDKEVVSSTMDGRPWEAGKFSLSLRLSLWAEHLGLHPGEVSCIMDPVDDSAYKNIWMATAKENTTIYEQVFSCVPNDHIHSRYQLRQSFAHRKEKIGHTIIDLGVSLEKPETRKDAVLAGTDPMEKLQAVRGHIVLFPLEFMCQEDLRPYFSESEFYTSPQVFH